MEKRTRILLALVLIVGMASETWLLTHPRDLLFHGKPEIFWITNIVYYGGDEQTKPWRDLGPDGVRLLARAVGKSDSVLQRAYRKTYYRFSHKLPAFLVTRLPKPPERRWTRLCVLSLLRGLDKDAKLAEPAIARAMKDSDDSVRQIAIGCYEGLLPAMSPVEKNRRLPEFLRGMRSTRSGIRNNSAVALWHFPDHARTVGPVLVKAMSEPDDRVRILIAKALAHVDPQAAVKAGVVTIAIQFLKDPDDQIAYQAAEMLGEMAAEPTLSVPALLERAQGTNSLVATFSLRALSSFPDQADTIVPVLLKAAENPDRSIRKTALSALKRVDAAAAAKAGVK